MEKILTDRGRQVAEQLRQTYAMALNGELSSSVRVRFQDAADELDIEIGVYEEMVDCPPVMPISFDELHRTLVHWRVYLHIDQKVVARALGISVATLDRLERSGDYAHAINMDQVQIVFRALGLEAAVTFVTNGKVDVLPTRSWWRSAAYWLFDW